LGGVAVSALRHGLRAREFGKEAHGTDTEYFRFLRCAKVNMQWLFRFIPPWAWQLALRFRLYRNPEEISQALFEAFLSQHFKAAEVKRWVKHLEKKRKEKYNGGMQP
jgi:hypothetical protein